MKKVPVTENGQACRRCGMPVIKKKGGPKSSKTKTFFGILFVCSGCKTVYLDSRSQKPNPLYRENYRLNLAPSSDSTTPLDKNL